MSFTKQLIQLRDAMAVLIPFRQDVIPPLTDAAIQWQNIDINVNNPVTLWHNIIAYAEANNQVNDLVGELLKRFPGNSYLLAYKEGIDYSLGPEVKEPDWKGKIDKSDLEKITGDKTTLLPISFLQTGLARAKSVARVLVSTSGGTSAGTGFLLPNNIFITNNHVLPDKATAAIAKIQFRYELDHKKLPLNHIDFDTDPDNSFATSEANDWTAVKLKGDANTEFGFTELKNTTVNKNDFVNIIQHPGGDYKQIGMYHNLVTFSDNNIVQYLTDTEPGSSGSPVFNSDWEVVALHHSGGMLREPGTTQKLLRNEGININVVIAGLKAANLLI
jgi:S1-C subfamily serine protease